MFAEACLAKILENLEDEGMAERLISVCQYYARGKVKSEDRKRKLQVICAGKDERFFNYVIGG